MKHVGDDERRARLATRQALAPGHRAASPEGVARAMTALHATEAATVSLACAARMDRFALPDVDRALYEDRCLVRQLAMRRTLWVVPRDLLPAVLGSAARRVEHAERRSILKDLEAAGIADPSAHLDGLRGAVLAALRTAPDGLTVREARAAVGEIDVQLPTATGSGSLASRVMRHLGLTGDAVRGQNTAGWRALQPRWTTPSAWLSDAGAVSDAADGWTELTRRYLTTFGPATEDDLVWWLGATKAIARDALRDLDAVAVSLDRVGTGWLLPDDAEPVAAPAGWTALLPVLDPTAMGHKHRDFAYGPHAQRLFDANGNAGTTAWVDGRAVGGWVQDDTAAVQLRLLETVAARRSLEDQARRLTELLAGTRIATTVPSPLMRQG